MANLERNIRLTEDLSRFIDAQVERGHHSPSEVVREALRRYETELMDAEVRIEELR